YQTTVPQQPTSKHLMLNKTKISNSAYRNKNVSVMQGAAAHQSAVMAARALAAYQRANCSAFAWRAHGAPALDRSLRGDTLQCDRPVSAYTPRAALSAGQTPQALTALHAS